MLTSKVMSEMEVEGYGLYTHDMTVNESVHRWFQTDDNLGRVTLDIVLDIKTSKIFLGVFGGTLREHKILQGISKIETTPIGMGMVVSFSRHMGISFCKMSHHFFSCDTQCAPIGYPLGIMGKNFYKKLCLFIHSVMHSEQGSFRSKWPLAPPRMHAYFQNSVRQLDAILEVTGRSSKPSFLVPGLGPVP